MTKSEVTISDGVVVITTTQTNDIGKTTAIQGTSPYNHASVLVAVKGTPTDYESDADTLFQWLRSSIPSGTYDRLFTIMRLKEEAKN